MPPCVRLVCVFPPPTPATVVANARRGYRLEMNPSYTFDPGLHRAGSVAARGRCSWHGTGGTAEVGCLGDPVVSFQDAQGTWQSGCQQALEELVAREEIAPLGQGA